MRKNNILVTIIALVLSIFILNFISADTLNLKTQIGDLGYNVTHIERGEGQWEYGNVWNYVLVSINKEGIAQQGNINLLLGSDVVKDIDPLIENNFPDAEIWITIIHTNCGNRYITCIYSRPELNYGGCSENFNLPIKYCGENIIPNPQENNSKPESVTTKSCSSECSSWGEWSDCINGMQTKKCLQPACNENSHVQSCENQEIQSQPNSVTTISSEPSELQHINLTEACNGCLIGETCISFGYRLNNTYCDLSKKFISQKETDESCNNNFECQSNVCASDKCVSASLITRILNWFRHLFRFG